MEVAMMRHESRQHASSPSARKIMSSTKIQFSRLGDYLRYKKPLYNADPLYLVLDIGAPSRFRDENMRDFYNATPI